MQLERDANPSFQKVVAPLATDYTQFNKDAKIIGYKKSEINTNHYVVRELSEVYVVIFWKCLKKLKGIYAILPHQTCAIQQYDANENEMVCIYKVNWVSFYSYFTENPRSMINLIFENSTVILEVLLSP